MKGLSTKVKFDVKPYLQSGLSEEELISIK